MTDKKTNKGKANKDIGKVEKFARDHKTTLKALGWVLNPVGMAAQRVTERRSKGNPVTGTSKGMRGSEKTSSGFPASKASKVKAKTKTRKEKKPLTSVTATAARLEKWRREHG